jgi:poly(A) polymerase
LRLYNFTREKMKSLPPEEVRPTPLVTGDDLIAAGYSPGPLFKEILAAIEDAQLDGKLQSKEEAMQLVRREFALEIKASP